MSDGSDLSTAVAELEGGAVTATLLSHGLQNLARLMEYAGAPEVALRTEAIDIPALLALPPEQARALLTQLHEAVNLLGAACCPTSKDSF